LCRGRKKVMVLCWGFFVLTEVTGKISNLGGSVKPSFFKEKGKVQKWEVNRGETRALHYRASGKPVHPMLMCHAKRSVPTLQKNLLQRGKRIPTIQITQKLIGYAAIAGTKETRSSGVKNVEPCRPPGGGGKKRKVCSKL